MVLRTLTDVVVLAELVEELAETAVVETVELAMEVVITVLLAEEGVVVLESMTDRVVLAELAAELVEAPDVGTITSTSPELVPLAGDIVIVAEVLPDVILVV